MANSGTIEVRGRTFGWTEINENSGTWPYMLTGPRGAKYVAIRYSQPFRDYMLVASFPDTDGARDLKLDGKKVELRDDGGVLRVAE